MRFLHTFSAKAACLAIAISGFVSVASASEIRLHVPVEARWGSQTLPPGDYKFVFTPSSPVARVSGNGTVATVFVTSVVPRRIRERGSLRIVDVHGTPTVAAFTSGDQGVTYEFALPKPPAHNHDAAIAEADRGL